jgi:hypothetical protein
MATLFRDYGWLGKSFYLKCRLRGNFFGSLYVDDQVNQPYYRNKKGTPLNQPY